ncbi:MAG TPA: EF-hand domain-containing protein [Gallionella sp.]|nr:EF-hand domain-containing protein [Gallionella sp.]
MSMSIGGVSSGLSMQAVSGASMRMPPAQKMSQLFQQIDTNNTGSISKEQFKAAFQNQNPPAGIRAMGADAVFSKLDPNNTGSVSKQDFVSGMKEVLSQSRGHRAAHQEQVNNDAAAALAASRHALETLGTQPAAQAQAIGANININA